MITQDQFQSLLDAKKAAEKDNTPFAIVTKDEMYVAGDPNLTEVKSRDYTMGFIVPKEWKPYLDPKEILKEKGNYIAIAREFKGVMINPRHYSSALSAILELQPFFNAIYENEDGELSVRDLTPEEVQDVFRYMNDEMTSALFHAVAVILKVPEELEDYMAPSDVILTAMRFMADFPEIVNDADSFFEFSAGKAVLGSKTTKR